MILTFVMYVKVTWFPEMRLNTKYAANAEIRAQNFVIITNATFPILNKTIRMAFFVLSAINFLKSIILALSVPHMPSNFAVKIICQSI